MHATRDRRVCIVTPGYLSSTPRVVREADALWGAGYDVRVVFTQGQLASIREFDRELIESRPWRTTAVNWSGTTMRGQWLYHWSRVRHGIARALPQAAWGIDGVVERAQGRMLPELASLTASEPADVFIGHYPDGLAAACYAASRFDARVGYDVEDLYADSVPLTRETEKLRARILQIEGRYVPRCAYVTAVSAPVANAFAERYPHTNPVVVHNSHPWSERDAMDGRVVQRRSSNLSLYWVSQTVGLDRGIQDVIRAVGRLGLGVEIHVQGAADQPVKQTLAGLAAQCGVASALNFHASAPPHELLSRAAEHDVGLALETGAWTNNRLTVSNKLLLYLAAGLAAAVTDVPGQRGVMETCPHAGALYAPGDVDGLARILDTWSRNPAAVMAAKCAALDAARAEWNWERECQQVIAAVSDVLGSRQAYAS